jgi:hypothetical protein
MPLNREFVAPRPLPTLAVTGEIGLDQPCWRLVSKDTDGTRSDCT